MEGGGGGMGGGGGGRLLPGCLTRWTVNPEVVTVRLLASQRQGEGPFLKSSESTLDTSTLDKSPERPYDTHLPKHRYSIHV